MKQCYSLETVAANFKHWRETRHSNRETTPKYLQEQVAALKKEHKAITIRNTLNLSSATFNRWCETHQYEPVRQAFIAISPEVLSVSEAQNKSDILCEFPNGVRLSFNTESLGRSVLTELFCLKQSAINT
jgi:hypothetical protein